MIQRWSWKEGAEIASRGLANKTRIPVLEKRSSQINNIDIRSLFLSFILCVMRLPWRRTKNCAMRITRWWLAWNLKGKDDNVNHHLFERNFMFDTNIFHRKASKYELRTLIWSSVILILSRSFKKNLRDRGGKIRGQNFHWFSLLLFYLSPSSFRKA